MIRSAVLAAFLLASPMAAQAATSPAAPSGNAAPGMTLNHFLTKHTKRIMSADTNGDGRVSRVEWSAMPAKAGSDRSQRFDKMDTNHDGFLDETEIRAAFTRRFQHMDSNGDGVVSPDERKARRMRHDKGATPAAPAQPGSHGGR
jgi:hypothetical protein